MVTYIEQIVDMLIEIEKKIRNKEICIQDVSLEEILSLVEMIYINETGSGEEISLTARNLLGNAVSDCNQNNYADILHLFILQLSILNRQRMQLQQSRKDYTAIFVRHEYRKNKIRNETCEPRDDNWLQGQGRVYTVITGDYDNVLIPENVSSDLDYFLFTNNNNIKSDFWIVVYIENVEKLNNAYLSRHVKFFHKKYLRGYDYSIYQDSSVRIIGDMKEFIRKYYVSGALICFNHSKNNCIYDEEKDCEALKKDSVEVMRRQMDMYRSEQYPEHNGLILGTVLVRSHHSGEVDQLMEEWWKQLINGSKRDQLSFNYVCWKLNFHYDSVDVPLYDSGYFRYEGHK